MFNDHNDHMFNYLNYGLACTHTAQLLNEDWTRRLRHMKIKQEVRLKESYKKHSFDSKLRQSQDLKLGLDERLGKISQDGTQHASSCRRVVHQRPGERMARQNRAHRTINFEYHVERYKSSNVLRMNFTSTY